MVEKVYQVDAFTHEPFKGNPAGVLLMAGEKSEEWMQSFAREMNLSETAFLVKFLDKYLLRWFTPKVEVDLCGHATLASAHVLFSEGFVAKEETIIFESASGLLNARFDNGWVELDFPAFQLKEELLTERIKDALGFEPCKIFQSDVNLLVELDSFEAVNDFQPDYEKITLLPYQGLIITSRVARDFDFVSRYFAPQAGINEDPVTGSAHCSLAPYWSEKLGKKEFTAYQASARGGVLKIKLENDRTFIQGQAVTIFKGDLAI